jgi:hypothetical protein
MILIKIIKKISELKVETDLNSRATSSPAQVGKSRPRPFPGNRSCSVISPFAAAEKLNPSKSQPVPLPKFPNANRAIHSFAFTEPRS